MHVGLWRYSRHPNHVGEQIFWWGLAMFAVSSGDFWTLIGPLFNTICMVRSLSPCFVESAGAFHADQAPVPLSNTDVLVAQTHTGLLAGLALCAQCPVEKHRAPPKLHGIVKAQVGLV